MSASASVSSKSKRELELESTTIVLSLAKEMGTAMAVDVVVPRPGQVVCAAIRHKYDYPPQLKKVLNLLALDECRAVPCRLRALLLLTNESIVDDLTQAPFRNLWQTLLAFRDFILAEAAYVPSAEAIRVITLALTFKWAASEPELVLPALWCVLDIVLRLKTRGEDMQAVAVMCGPIIATMRAHIRNQEICLHGTACLANASLAVSAADSKDAVDIILAVLRAHESSAEICSAGCLGLENLTALATANRAYIVSVEGVERVLFTFLLEDDIVNMLACRALARLCTEDIVKDGLINGVLSNLRDLSKTRNATAVYSSASRALAVIFTRDLYFVEGGTVVNAIAAVDAANAVFGVIRERLDGKVSDSAMQASLQEVLKSIGAKATAVPMAFPRCGGGCRSASASVGGGGKAEACTGFTIGVLCAAGCGVVGTNVCGRCKAVFYCSSACQRAHWSVHKKLCPVAR